MIKLYMFPPAFGLRSPSPFCLKAEMTLEYLDIEYQIELLGDPRKAPKGKLPFIEADNERVADSELIAEWLDRRTHGGLFGQLKPEEMARGTAFTRLAEDHLYWLMVASRWLDDEWWPNVEKGFFGAMPGIVRAVVAPMARKQVKQAYYSQGLGRHTLAEQQRFVHRDLEAISDALAASSFIAGSRMSVFDFAVVAQLTAIMDIEPATWATSIAAEFPRLRDYADRIQDATRCYGRQASN